MLDACADAVILKAFYQRDCHLAGHHGIFREIFKVSAAERRTLDIDTGAEKNRNLFFKTFFTESLTHFLDKLGIP